METWDVIKKKKIETPAEMAAFLDDIIEVCKKHGLSISHEDCHGAFCIEEYCEENIEWLRNADKCYERG